MTGFELESEYRLTANDRVKFSLAHTSASFVNEPNTAAHPVT